MKIPPVDVAPPVSLLSGFIVRAVFFGFCVILQFLFGFEKSFHLKNILEASLLKKNRKKIMAKIFLFYFKD